MLKRFWRWMRVVAPPAWVFAILFAALFAVLGFEVGVGVWISWNVSSSLEYLQIPVGYSTVLPIGLILYACWRTLAFHPALRAGYRTWLEQVPWQAPQSLPMGPAHLVMQDVLLVGLAMLVWNLPGSRLCVPLFFLLPYCVLQTYANLRTGVDWAGLSCLFIFASLLLVFNNSILLLLLMLTATLICNLGLRQSLRLFPWEKTKRWEAMALKFNSASNKEPAKAKVAFWPLVHSAEFGDLRPLLTQRMALCLSLFGAWFAFCATTNFLQHASTKEFGLFNGSLPLILLVLGLAGAIFRLAIYCGQHWPSISWRGRLSTRRFILPGYDRVLLAPLFSIAAGHLLPTWLIALSIPTALVAGVVTFIILACSFCFGPTLSDWHLTGEHRIPLSRREVNWVQL